MRHMKKAWSNMLAMVGVVLLAACLAGCEETEEYDELPDTNAEKTVIMYLPWTGNGSASLYRYFQQNITDINNAVTTEGGLGDKQLLIFISESATQGVLIRLRYENGVCFNDTIRTYNNTEDWNLTLNSKHWVTYLMNQVCSYAPADIYSLIIGSHGYGWIDAEHIQEASAAKALKRRLMMTPQGERPITRGSRSFGYTGLLTDISTLAEGIAESNIGKMQYILFDDCNMNNIETAYALREVTDYLIASPTEIMAYGMPYEKMWKYLADVSPNYDKICNEFYNFYSTYHVGEYDCGTIGVTDCSQVDSIASLMKQINKSFTFDTSLVNTVQNLDGYNPPIFFDLGDYVRNLCTDTELLATFEAQLQRLVPHKANTEYYFSALSRYGRHLITSYSGITISDPSQNEMAAGKSSTAFHAATHEEESE